MTQNTQSKILVVEDEPDIRELIAIHLGREGYHVEEASDGEGALTKIQTERHHLYVLDWMLPRLSGLELIRALKGQPETQRAPILMVTARMEAVDIVAGLEAGADDYITKPFEIPVFLARVRALLRRSQREATHQEGAVSEILQSGDLVINLRTHQVTCQTTPVVLTPSEFKLLHALLKDQGRVMTRSQLIDLVQGTGVAVVDRAIDTHVFGLRKKLGVCGDVIETVRGIGYRIR